MIFPLKLFIILIASLSFQNCENEKTAEQRDGLIIYQENQISWVRNFEPLNPVSICRWPTRGGIYETLFLGNPVTTEWIPWLATNYEWKNDNEKLVYLYYKREISKNKCLETMNFLIKIPLANMP